MAPRPEYGIPRRGVFPEAKPDSGRKNGRPHYPGSTFNLQTLLSKAAGTDGRLVFYSEGSEGLVSTTLSYRELLEEATDKAHSLANLITSSSSPDNILLLHFDTQRAVIVWFWAATIAGFLPAISLPLANDELHRKNYLLHLHDLLSQPTILTAEGSSSEFLGLHQLNLIEVSRTMAQQAGHSGIVSAAAQIRNPSGLDDIAVLMLTSGSTGKVKAVPLRNGQILQSVNGKSIHHDTTSDDIFLNWIGLDHVAGLTEVHLHAMSLGAAQVHVPAPVLMRDPLRFVSLLDLHKVAYTFAPNFFLAMVHDCLMTDPSFTADVSTLKALITGGESNPTSTCRELTRELQRLGARGEVIRPGFGMTETCAGSIYSRSCPSYDINLEVEFASLGTCIPGVQMRVMSITKPGHKAAAREIGGLQLQGPLVFDQYYNDESASQEAFTPDRWFVTGDLAWMDDGGTLHLAGRVKDTIIVNGVKWSATQLEAAIEGEQHAGILPSFTVAFPARAAGSPTESIAIAYVPAFPLEDDRARSETATVIEKLVSFITSRKPAHVIPLPQSRLEKSSLGKISRSKVREAFERGEYEEIQRDNLKRLVEYRQKTRRGAQTATEMVVWATLTELLNVPAEDMDAGASIFDLGVDSFNLIRLKGLLEKDLGADIDIPMSVLLKEPTIIEIACAIDQLSSGPSAYTPIVPLQLHGSSTPLFCIHPGSGDILVFIALAAHFPSRPIYALRSRGYNPKERLFESIQETAETYAAHIRETQPEGPYAVAGYSLGSTLAFEVAKVLESQGQQVKFLASIDYPPDIAHYVCGLDWTDVLLHIAFFLELIDEKTMVDITARLHELGRDEALSHVLAIGDAVRTNALALDENRLGRITDIAENFRVNVQGYQPLGKVECLDVFVAEPPSYAARDRQDWRDNKLGRWVDFARSEVEFHDCPGIHAKMLNREHMAGFAKVFKAAMRRRGV